MFFSVSFVCVVCVLCGIFGCYFVFFALSLLSFKLECYHDQTQTKMHMDGAMNDFVSWCMIHHVSYQRFCMHSYRVSHLT